MQLRILNFRYYTRSVLEDIRENICSKIADEGNKEFAYKWFDDILKVERWESHAVSTDPEVDFSANKQELKTILESCGQDFEFIEDIKVHWLRVSSNPFEFERVLIFDCGIKAYKEIHKREGVKDRLKHGLNDIQNKVDLLFTSQKDELEDLDTYIWIIIGNEKWKAEGLSEKPHKKEVIDDDVWVETYNSDDAQYILYSDEEFVDKVELSDLSFLLLVPSKQPKLNEKSKELDDALRDWQEAVSGLIDKFMEESEPEKRKKYLKDIAREMNKYISFSNTITGELSNVLLTLGSFINRAGRAEETQLIRFISEDMKKKLVSTNERAYDLRRRWEEAFNRLKDIFSIAAQSTEIDLQEATTKSSEGIVKLLKKANLMSIFVAALVFVQSYLLLLQVFKTPSEKAVIMSGLVAIVFGSAVKFFQK